ncbi:MAG: TetR family transcriptional regulator [Solobacterium sp.]|nr:TetR family transcriptional regulator [Solobacterium sp.]
MSERTKLWIAGKMKELMKHKQINQIRTTEICRAAGIDRSTFYYHFKDKYDLIAWVFYHDAYITDVTDEKLAVSSMKKVKKEVLFYRRAYADNSQNALWNYLQQYFIDEYLNAAKKKLDTDDLPEELVFAIRLYCYGSTVMAREWILNDDVTPAETVVHRMFSSMPPLMRRVCTGSEETAYKG